MHTGPSFLFSIHGRVFALLLLLGLMAPAHALLIGFGASVPDSNFEGVLTTYTESTSTLTVQSDIYILYRDAADVAHTPTGGSLTISMVLDRTLGSGVDDVTVASSTFTMVGDIPGITTGSQTLLEGVITDIGADASVDTIDMLGTATGGLFLTAYQAEGFGVILNEVGLSNSPTGDFANNFQTNVISIPGLGDLPKGTADVTTPSTVPSPATAMLLLVGLAAARRVRASRSAKA